MLQAFYSQIINLSRLLKLCLDSRCRLEQFDTVELQRKDYTQYLCVCLCVCARLCIHVIVWNMCVVVLYLHSKDLIKVSKLTRQLMVNLASFSHSPTHSLSIFLTVSQHIQACCCTNGMCIGFPCINVHIRTDCLILKR